MRVWKWVVGGTVVVALVGGFTAYHFLVNTVTPTAADKSAEFVTASPVDMNQIATISRFRSCSGHDYSGKDIDGVTESNRSMKNYASPLNSLSGTTNQVTVFAPFDATVLKNQPGKQGDNFDLTPTAAPDFVYELGHITSIKTLTKGTAVKAGDLVGYYNGTGAFDLQLRVGGPNTVNGTNGYLDSIFAHMSPALADQLKPYGVSADTMIVSQAERDANPCASSGQQSYGSVEFTAQADDLVTIKNAGATTPAAPSNAGTPSNNSNGGPVQCANLPADQRPPDCRKQ